jgi:hypothetical protein
MSNELLWVKVNGTFWNVTYTCKFVYSIDRHPVFLLRNFWRGIQPLLWRHDTQHNDTQDNDIPQNDTQYNDTHHNDTA